MLEVLGIHVNTWDLLPFIQTRVVIPQSYDNRLKSVHEALCGRKSDVWWEQNFYDVQPFEKLELCYRILDESTGEDERKEFMSRLLEINKADFLALGEIVKKLLELPIK